MGTMKTRHFIVVAIVFVLIAAISLLGFMSWKPALSNTEPFDVFVGVGAAYDNVEEIKTLVDAVSPYTNLFIIGSTGITHNETKLNDLSQYIYDKGLSFIVYTEMPPRIGAPWIEYAKATWGSKFLGLYVHDEPGGKQLDLFTKDGIVRHPVKSADNYTDARNQFVNTINVTNAWMTNNFTHVNDVQIFTSDYALYWFDYLGGYDTMFAEFGWNYSRQMNVALVRGAATAQNKDWGIIITWKYEHPPYIESGEELYNDVVLAYNNGAKYVVIFDTNQNYTHGVIGEEHLQAVRNFTEYAHKNPRTSEPASVRTAFVLPKDFAYGFRGPTDKIWGLWEANDLAFDISVRLGKLLQQYGSKLDVIYDDGIDYDGLGYGKFIFWNGTVLGG